MPIPAKSSPNVAKFGLLISEYRVLSPQKNGPGKVVEPRIAKIWHAGALCAQTCNEVHTD